MDSDLSKSSPVSSKDSKRSKESKDKKSNKTEDAKNKDEVEDLKTFKCNPSSFLKDMVEANEEYVSLQEFFFLHFYILFELLSYRYEDIWKFRDDGNNQNEKYDSDMVEREKMLKVEQEIRNIVDETMRSELELLQAALDRDRAHKGKKSKKPQKKVIILYQKRIFLSTYFVWRLNL